MNPQPDARRFGDLNPAEITSEQLEVIKALMDGPRQGIGGPFAAMLRSPRLADAIRKVGDYVRFDSTIPPQLNEMAILITARHWTAQYEFFAHRYLALRAGLRTEIVDAIARDERPADMDDNEAVVHEFTMQLLKTGSVADGVFEQVRARFQEQGVVDLIGVVGYYCLVSFILNVDRYPMPEGKEPPLSPSM